MTEETPITADDVRRIARLAHLPVSDEEVARFTRELGEILAYVRQLEEVDVSAVPPTAHASFAMTPAHPHAAHLPMPARESLPDPRTGKPARIDHHTLRADEPEQSLPRELALREAPRVAMDGFAVPAFVDEG